MGGLSEIVHADFSPVWRGGQQQLWLLAHGLRESGYGQTLVAPEGEVAARFAGAGFLVLAPGSGARRAARQAPIVHAHDGRAHGWMLRALAGAGARRVLSRRVAFAIRNPVSRWKYRRLDLVLAVSRFVAAQVLATGLPASRVSVIPDGIALQGLPDVAAARKRVRDSCRISAETPCFVCLSALTFEKGVPDAVAALAHMPGECHLLLPGSGPLLARLRQQAHRLGTAPRIHFVADHGFPGADWVAAGDVLLMPSIEEGFGSAALLAMALGRPVVATRTGGIPELIEDGVTGLLVPARSAPALAQAALRLLREPILKMQIAAAARAQVEARYTATHMTAATLAAYQRLG